MTARLLSAVVVAGGRSSRLGGTAKALLRYRGETLLSRTVAAVREAGAHRVVVVGPEEELGSVLPEDVLVVRETPAFSGPAAAIGAGVDRLVEAPDGRRTESLCTDDVTLLLACDMPHVGSTIRVLLDTIEAHPEFQAWVPKDADGKLQYLACAVRTEDLLQSVTAAGDLIGKPVRVLLASLQVYTFTADSTADVDTPADAATFGIAVQDGIRH